MTRGPGVFSVVEGGKPPRWRRGRRGNTIPGLPKRVTLEARHARKYTYSVKLRLHSLRKHRTWLAVLLLPALLFRAFIPVGFMPVVESGGLTIGFCPGEAALPPGVAAAVSVH